METGKSHPAVNGASGHTPFEKDRHMGDERAGVTVHEARVATPEEEARVIRKLDYRLLPLVFVLYSLAVLDRSNLGNARLAGLEDDVDLTGSRYNWLGTIFYIAYICSQWTVIGWKAFPPHIFCSFTVFFWGFVATIQAACTSWASLMVCRFFLGIAEAMFGPGVPLYLTFFYPRDKVGFRHGVFISGSAMANAYGGALAYGISQARGSIAPWQILFIVEGLPTVLLAAVVWFYLPDSIQQAAFLNDDEKRIAQAFVARNQSEESGKGNARLSFRELLEPFKDPKSFIPALMYFGANVSFSSLPLFVPTIISQIGIFTRIQSNGLSAPPYLLCVFTILLFCFLSDRFNVRGPLCFVPAVIAAIGFILQATTTSPAARYVGVFLSIQIFVCVAIILAWTASLSTTESRRAGGYVIIYTIGQCGPLLGTNVFPEHEKPYYRKGMWISASFCLLVAGCSLLLSGILLRENKKMEKEETSAMKNGQSWHQEHKIKKVW